MKRLGRAGLFERRTSLFGAKARRPDTSHAPDVRACGVVIDRIDIYRCNRNII